MSGYSGLQRPASWLPLFGLIVCSAMLGSAHVFARLSYAYDVNVLTAAAARLTCASVLVLVYLCLRRVKFPVLRQAYRATCVLGLLACAQTVSLQIAVLSLPVAIAILVFYTFPFFTGIGSALIGDERLSLRLVAALIVAFAGLALVVGVEFKQLSLSGLAAALAASLFFTLTLILTPRLAPELSAPMRTFFMMSLAAAILLAVLGGTGAYSFPNSGDGWAAFAVFALLYGLGINGLFMLLPKLGATQTAVALNLEPVMVAVIGFFVVGELLSGVQIIGALIVVSAVMAYQMSARRR
ncbi:MAG: DMT family transporter [Betaproteobacteria bacterium]|nr:DMT family transporter [Betaproteobacteria bacterium]